MYLNASVVQDADGRPHYLLVYLRDITERKSLEEQLRQAQKMEAVGQLAGGIAHDFNNLLTAILGSTELLLASTDGRRSAPRRRAGDRPRGRTGRRRSCASCWRSAASRSCSRGWSTSTRSCSEMGGMLRRVVGERIALRLDLDPALGHVTPTRPDRAGDRQPRRQRARRHARRRHARRSRTANVERRRRAAPATTALAPGGPLVLLTVSDTGTGMDEHVLAHLFEPFFTTKELGRGHRPGPRDGLRHRAAERRARSRWPRGRGEGSTFTVYFPARRAPGAAGAPRRPRAPAGAGRHGDGAGGGGRGGGARIWSAACSAAKGYRVLEAPHAEAALAWRSTTASRSTCWSRTW